MMYPSIPSSIAPVPHSDALPVPNPPSNVSNFLWVSVTNSKSYVLRLDPISCYACSLLFQVETYLSEDSATASENSDIDAEYAPTTSAEPLFPIKQELDDLIRDLGLTKSKAELLTSRLNEWNLIGDDCKSTAYRKRHLEFSVYFDVIEDLCYCKDVEGLFSAVGTDHNPTQRRLFIDSSTKSLKVVLLHNGNIYPSIPLANSLQMKEDY